MDFITTVIVIGLPLESRWRAFWHKKTMSFIEDLIVHHKYKRQVGLLALVVILGLVAAYFWHLYTAYGVTPGQYLHLLWLIELKR
jgi:hypothetical protein